MAGLSLTAGVCAHQATGQSLIAGFETGEGFVVNQCVTALSSWGGSTNNSAGQNNLRVSSASSHSGSNSLEAVMSNNQAYYFARTPNLYHRNAKGFSVWFTNPNAADSGSFISQGQIARLGIYHGTDGGASVANNQVQVYLRYGTSFSSPLQLYFYGNSVTTTTRTLTLEPGDLAQWNQLIIYFDFEESQIRASVNGVEVDPVTINSGITPESRFTHARIETTATNGVGNTFFDNLMTYGEPLIADFEAIEGFVSGEAPSYNISWGGSANNSGTKSYFRVTSSKAHSGSQSLEAIMSSNANYFFAITPNQYHQNAKGFSIWFTNPSAGYEASGQIARWSIYHGEGSGSQNSNNRIQVVLRYGTSEGSGLQLYFSGNNIATSTRTFPAGEIDLTEWNQLALYYDFDNSQLKASINGMTVAPVTITGGITSESRFTHARIDMTAASGVGTVYHDTLMIIRDEHLRGTLVMMSSIGVPLCGLPPLLLVYLRKRRRF